jgi:hypothetical protein
MIDLDFRIYKTAIPCSEDQYTVNIPGLNLDYWLCVELKIKFLFWTLKVNKAVHCV